jgi:hypothetical protein
MEKFEMEKFEAPVELDDVELDAVAGGILNDINIAAVNLNSAGATAYVVDNSSSDLAAPV